MKYRPILKATLLVLVLGTFAVSAASASTISVRGHSNYGLGGPGEQIGTSQNFTLPDGTVLTGQAECPTSGLNTDTGQCGLMFIYTLDSLGSSTSSLKVNFTGLSNFDLNGTPVFGSLTTGILTIDDANVDPMSHLPGIDPLLLAQNGTSIDATGGPGSVNFVITNPIVGLSFFFIDTANTQICPVDETTGFADCTQANLSLAAVPAPSSTTTVAPEPSSALLVLFGLVAGLLVVKRTR